MNDNPTQDLFPPFNPPPPRAGEQSQHLDADTSARLHAAIAQATGVVNPMESSAPGGKKKVEDRAFEEMFPGQEKPSEVVRLLQEIRSVVENTKASVDNLPINLSQIMENR